MRRVLLIWGGFALVCGATTAQALVKVDIDLTRQRMHVDSNEGGFDWPISSARSGFYTPGGSFAPTHLERMHYSKKYHMSPMPYAIFFRGGYAIHGTYSTASLGRPASHGCVRLSPGDAATLYGMVEREGARISIHGSPPTSRPFYVSEGGAHRRIAPTDDYAPAGGYYGYDAPYPGYGYVPATRPESGPFDSLFGY